MASPHEIGLVQPDDGYLHATRQGLVGTVAICGAGRTAQAWPGRFDIADERSCPACVEALSRT